MDLVSCVLGAVFVFSHAFDRFNTPPTNRSSTTALRYYSAASLYVAFGVLLYVVMVLSPEILGYLQVAGGGALEKVRGLSPPLIAALLLTVLLPNVSILSQADERIRSRLQVCAAIPHAARSLASELRRARFVIPDQWQQRLESALVDAGFKPDEIAFDDRRALSFEWIKVSALLLQLEEWASDRRYASFVDRFSTEYQALRSSYLDLQQKAVHAIRLAVDSRGVDGESHREAIRLYQKDFRERNTRLLDSICSFVSRGLLQCELRYGARLERLAVLGFQVELVQPRLTLNQLMSIFAVVALIMFAALAVPGGGDHIGDILLRGVMIATIYLTAIWCAVIPKERARRAGTTLMLGERPVLSYLLSGGSAAVLGWLVGGVFRLVMTVDPAVALRDTLQRYPWGCVSFVTAALTSYLIDDENSASSGRLRWLEAGGLAAANAAAGWLAHAWLQQVSTSPVPPRLMVVLSSALIGGIIGFLIPTWYRNAPRRPERTRIRRILTVRRNDELDTAA